MRKNFLYGSIPALLTPFSNGRIDEGAFQRFVDWNIREGSHGVLTGGTTGESPTLTHSEHKRLMDLVVEVVRKRVPIVAGSGSNSTSEAIALTCYAERAGADAALVIAPYYNKPTQEGLYRHFRAIHDASGIPLILYNVPSRTGCDILPSTVVRLSRLERIAGIKDASNDLSRPARLRADVRDFVQLSGEDATAVAFLAQGGCGCISVSANIAPRTCAAVQEAWRSEDYARARRLDDSLTSLHQALFLETSPSPVKYAASLLGKCKNEMRLPLVSVSRSTEEAVRSALEQAGISF